MLQVWVGVPRERTHWLNSSFPGTPRNGHGGTELRCLHRRGAGASQVADFKRQPPLYWNNPQKAVNTVCSKSHTWAYEELLETSPPSDPGFKGFISKKICFHLLSSHSDSISCCPMWKKNCDLGIGTQAVMGKATPWLCFLEEGSKTGLPKRRRYLRTLLGGTLPLPSAWVPGNFKWVWIPVWRHWECCSETMKGKFVGSWTSHKVHLASLFILF